MKKFFLILVLGMIVGTAMAQTPITYTHTKTVYSNGVEQEGGYSQIRVMLVGNQLKRAEYPTLTWMFHHQDNGWSVYYRAVWHGRVKQWIIQYDEWYAVSPDQQTINHCYPTQTIGGNTYVSVYKQGIQHKSIGPMYE